MLVRSLSESAEKALAFAVSMLPSDLEIVEEKPAKKRIKIGLNSGHAGTAGARGKNKDIKEEVENRVQRDRVRELLEATGRFECVNIDQSMFKGDLLATGKAFAGCRVGISFHQNAANGIEHGAECLHSDSAESKELGLKLSKAMANAQGIKDRGLNSRKVSIITGAQQAGCPCFVLTESSFIDDETSQEECRAETLAAAEAIAKVLIGHFSE